MLVTGGPGVLGGDGMPQRIIVSSVPPSVLRITGAEVGKDARHWRKVADVAIDHAEERDDGGLVGRDAVEIAHLIG
jgi:hypothetical protein